MSLTDPNGAGGQTNWRMLLERTLPHVDIFMPSIDEILFMLRRSDYDEWQGQFLEHISLGYLDELVDELFSLGGSSVVGVKLGEYGMYVRTGNAASIQRLARIPVDVNEWASKRIWHPAFDVDVIGTTGAGDSAYAGFLTAMLHGLSAEKAVEWACAVGACCVETADATSGVQSWEATRRRLESGWQTRSRRLSGNS
jgi:sugar/nucleoside kinase (ribokinase family)